MKIVTDKKEHKKHNVPESILEKFSLLSEENKKLVNSQIEILIASQSLHQ